MAWEDCEGNIRRQEVPGGWIYKIPEPYLSAVFVPEPNKVTGPTPEQADKASDEAYDEAYTDGWRAAGGKVSVDEATTDYQRGWDAGYKASKDEGASASDNYDRAYEQGYKAAVRDGLAQHPEKWGPQYDLAYKDGWDAALMTFPHKLTPYENDLAIRDKLGKAYAQGFEDGRVSAYDGDTPEGGPDKVKAGDKPNMIRLLNEALTNLEEREIIYAAGKIVRVLRALEGK
jgi:hypothetical protein